MFGLSPGEVFVILVIALLIFGPKLPQVARGLGRSIGEFKKGIKESEEEIKKLDDEKKNS